MAWLAQIEQRRLPDTYNFVVIASTLRTHMASQCYTNADIGTGQQIVPFVCYHSEEVLHVRRIFTNSHLRLICWL
jgi:hypothetical protein